MRPIIGRTREAIYPMFAVKLFVVGLALAGWHGQGKTCISLNHLINEFDVLSDVTRRLTKAGIPHMLTGSLAMNYQQRGSDYLKAPLGKRFAF